MFEIPISEVTKDQRNIAKVINFGLCYGMSAKGLGERLNISTPKAESFIRSISARTRKSRTRFRSSG
jgi:DNA polymerase-1